MKQGPKEPRRERAQVTRGHSHQAALWCTADVPAAQAFEYWQDLICDTFVQLSSSPTTAEQFVGQIQHVVLDDVEMSTVRASGQEVRRTPRLIARSNEEYVLASIQLAGSGMVLQDDRLATLVPGGMAFYDSTRPYTLHFDGAFEQLVVQVPRRLLPVSTLRRGTALALAPEGSGRLVADFFVGLARQRVVDPDGAAALAPHAVGLLCSAVGLAAGAEPDAQSAAALSRQRVLAYLRQHTGDPDLNLDSIALACHLSRRSLFRVFADQPASVAETLRLLRVERAKVLLRSEPRRTVSTIAAACGFAGEAQLHRAFRDLTGMTPNGYRAAGGPDAGKPVDAGDGTRRQ